MNLIGATSGHATVLGVDSTLIRGKSYTEIGYVSENQEIPGWMKVGALLQYLRDFYPTWDRQLEDSLLKQFDLPRDRKIRALSRGMKMKLVLAGALAFHPKLIVLDEPFGGLDPLRRDQLIEGLLERAAESTVFISSHDLAEIESSPAQKRAAFAAAPSSVCVTSPHNNTCQRVAGNWNKSLKSPIAGLFTGTYGLPNSCFGLGKLSRLRLLMVGRSQLYSMNFRIDTWSV
jgi:ABC-type taurine transport system ATPase subunit